jgi:hypothetical protein
MLLFLQCGRVTTVDADHYRYQGTDYVLSRMRWSLVGKPGQKHVATSRFLMLHRIIADCPDGLHVDHIDGNPLNNTRENLRICTNQQNLRNMRPKGRTSKYKGVSRARDRFIARIMVDGKDVRRARFRTETEAALQYDEWAAELFGEFAWLNCNHFDDLCTARRLLNQGT